MNRPIWLSAPQGLRMLYILHRLATSPWRKKWPYISERIIAIIIVRDLYSNLTPLVSEFCRQGIQAKNIWLIDTGSTSRECLKTLKNLSGMGCKLIKPEGEEHKSGPYIAWLNGDIRKSIRKLDYPFLLTDPDLAFKVNTPTDWLEKAFDTLMKHAYVTKVGLPLCTEGIDKMLYESVQKNQNDLYQHWFFRRLNAITMKKTKGHICATDTTLALYRPKTPFSTFAIRLAFDYSLKHLPWHSTYRNSTEFKYYCDHKLQSFGEWSR